MRTSFHYQTIVRRDFDLPHRRKRGADGPSILLRGRPQGDPGGPIFRPGARLEGDTSPCQKALTSLQDHWDGLTRFVDDRRIPMDNNRMERRLRNPAVGRKNDYGSRAEWSGRMAARLFSLLATPDCWGINPRSWLIEHL